MTTPRKRRKRTQHPHRLTPREIGAWITVWIIAILIAAAITLMLDKLF